MDILTRGQRSSVMSRIKGRDTGPEMLVRRAAHALGLRFRLHAAKLPGRPDLVFASRKIALFVHGCFWHRHENCRLAYSPKSNKEFWARKFSRNVERDGEVTAALRSAGWRTAVIWECETRQQDLADRIGRLIIGTPQ
ncbi:very short patch repair endonuclease [Mesorhizobium sp. AR02]|uniref:very short patch repair endonuclease n=1 Tax=Mesorhizobium sp. AR02 TaxID=2865837 RepID=UPI0021609682|nr:very short patch repair endonuclease [Mesorhizobium sp. AR02]UVK55374.1 very short patch repair endonuclease [Mesorhizobium sp. AR02]